MRQLLITPCINIIRLFSIPGGWFVGYSCYSHPAAYPNDHYWAQSLGWLVTKASCPLNSQPTGSTTCTCNNNYVPDSTATSCVPANNCPANMSGSPCACNAGFVLNPYGAGCVVEQFTLSDPQNQTQLPDVEPGSSRAVAARVVSVQTGLPKQGAMVKVHLDVDLTSGGHDHGETTTLRPRGTISSSNCVPEPGAPDTYDCPTGPDGYTDSTFNAPKVSGTHTITATCISAHCSGSITDHINVKVDGLGAIPGSQFYTFTEPDGRGGIKVIGDNGNHSGNHYLTSDAASQLWRLAATYYFKYRQDTSVPLLHLNDASLIWGGRFDKNGNWADPHAGHRKGTVIDIRANALPTAIPDSLFTDFEILAAKIKTKLAGRVTSAIAEVHCSRGRDPAVDNCAGDNNRHFHVILLGVDQ